MYSVEADFASKKGLTKKINSDLPRFLRKKLAREIKSKVITLSINTMSGSIDKTLKHAISILKDNDDKLKLISTLDNCKIKLSKPFYMFEWYSLLLLLYFIRYCVLCVI